MQGEGSSGSMLCNGEGSSRVPDEAIMSNEFICMEGEPKDVSRIRVECLEEAKLVMVLIDLHGTFIASQGMSPILHGSTGIAHSPTRLAFAVIKTSTAAQQANITSEAKLTRQTDIDSHQGELENLAKEVSTQHAAVSDALVSAAAAAAAVSDAFVPAAAPAAAVSGAPVSTAAPAVAVGDAPACSAAADDDDASRAFIGWP
eukprot:scaffold263724_cov18-Tisochrysis_lutea.AAC.2